MTELDYSAADGSEKPKGRNFFGFFTGKKDEPIVNNDGDEASPRQSLVAEIQAEVDKVKAAVVTFGHEAYHELDPRPFFSTTSPKQAATFASSFFYVPFLPAFYRPGWLTNYAIGLVTPSRLEETLEGIWDDCWAGITVSLCLIPQGISYAGLANLPAIRGLYAAVLPSSVYTFLGSSMQLAVGPVAIVSLLTGKLVTQYDLQPRTETGATTAIKNLKALNRSIIAGDLASQAMICLGIILVTMSLLNLGSLIRFISLPVFSGFTTGAAMQIGLSQLKNGFGFTYSVPQAGDPTTTYNYEVMNWYRYNWNTRYTQTTLKTTLAPNTPYAKYLDGNGRLYRNYFAASIFIGLLVPLLLLAIFKSYYHPSPERKKSYAYRLFTFLCNVAPLIAMIIGAALALRIQTDHPDSYYARQLKTIGPLNSGIYDLIRIPDINFPWGKLFIDVIPLTLIAFMESYSVARKIAIPRNELHILNCSQELFAVGAANLIGSVGSSYPVAGSFSRSSLNAASGARTPLSKAACMLVIVIVISTLTQTLEYVPTAANSAVIWAALWNLIDFTDVWETFKVSKQDFFVQISTLVITFLLDTETGLACGIGLSIIFLLYEIAFSPKSAPYSTYSSKGAETIRFNNDLNFFSQSRIKDYIAFNVLLNREEPVEKITLDFIDVKHVDKSALEAFRELYFQADHQNVKVDIVNVAPDILASFAKAGILAPALGGESATYYSDKA